MAEVLAREEIVRCIVKCKFEQTRRYLRHKLLLAGAKLPAGCYFVQKMNIAGFAEKMK